MSISEDLKKVTQQLYPTGRAFGINKDGDRDKLEDALIIQEVEFYNESMDILNELLPDNDDFTAQFATNWEQRLELITDPLIPLADRKAAILRKMNHPGDIPARQSWDYMQEQLQLANFDVYVHDNTTGMTVAQVLNLGLTTTGNFGGYNFGAFNFGSVYSYYSSLFLNQNWGANNFGSFNFGGQTNYSMKVVNNIDWTKDQNFIINDWTKVFYVGAVDLGDFADVLTTRREEFRQLILKIKPVNTVAVLLINYT
jgi:hypothetical protein